MERGIIGPDITVATVDEKFKVGTVMTLGVTTYQYIKAGGTALTAYRFCYLNPGDYAVTAATTTAVGAVPLAICVPQIAVPIAYYAWAAIAGSFTAFLGLSCAANVKLYTTATSGLADDTATTLITGVQSMSTVGGANANTVCFSPVPMSVNCV